MSFFARFSKALGALGGGGVGSLLAWGLSVAHVETPPGTAAILPVLGSLVLTILAPPNSLTTPPPSLSPPTTSASL